jgi:hypothetical protein
MARQRLDTMSELTITLTVRPGIGRAAIGAFAASTDVLGTPICRYGGTREEAARLAQATALRCLGQLSEKGGLGYDAVRFRTVNGR